MGTSLGRVEVPMQHPATLEDMMREMLRAWLDDNLPCMVWHLVRDEIERVKRGQ